jgi:hypothetical protein
MRYWRVWRRSPPSEKDEATGPHVDECWLKDLPQQPPVFQSIEGPLPLLALRARPGNPPVKPLPAGQIGRAMVKCHTCEALRVGFFAALRMRVVLGTGGPCALPPFPMVVVCATTPATGAAQDPALPDRTIAALS